MGGCMTKTSGQSAAIKVPPKSEDQPKRANPEPQVNKPNPSSIQTSEQPKNSTLENPIQNKNSQAVNLDKIEKEQKPQEEEGNQGTSMVNGTKGTVTRIIEMDEIISERVGEGGLTLEICKEYGLREFDPSIYIELETLGKGAFGIVNKCMEIRNRELHAVKKMKMKGVKRDKMIDNLSSFLVEREISKSLLDLKHPNMACFKDNYYIIDSAGEIESLVLVSEAGDYSLRQLLECRKNLQNKNPPYTPDEALRIMIPIAKAYRDLQKHRIYHSDTKLDNIVYSDSGNKFVLIDFGVSNIFRPLSESNLSPDEIEIGSIVRGGTLDYNSPEKNKYSADVEENSEMIFNPFKCDMWALGICLEKMCIGSDPNIKIAHPLFERIRKGLKETDWRNRFDATRLCEELAELEKSLKPGDLDMGKIENDTLVLLKKRTWDEKPELIQSYNNANMPQERLAIALYQMEAVEKKHGGIVNEFNYEEHNALLFQLGDAHDIAGEYQRALGVYEELLALRMTRFSSLGKQNHNWTFNLHDIRDRIKKEGPIYSTQPQSAFDKINEIYHALLCIARTLGFLSQSQKSLEVLDKVIVIQSALFKDEKNEQVVITLALAAQQHGNLGQYEDALKKFEYVLEIQRQIYSDQNHDMIIFTLSNIAQQYSFLKQYEKAVEAYEKILGGQVEKLKTYEHPTVAVTLANMAGMYHALQKLEKSLETFQRAYDILVKIFKNYDHPQIARVAINLGWQYCSMGYKEKALEIFETCLGGIRGLHTSPDDPGLKDIENKIQELKASLNK